METHDDILHYAISEAISRGSTGLSEYELAFHPELSTVLESLWKKLDKPDSHTANAVAQKIAEIGSLSGIQLLLDQISQSSQIVETLFENNDPRIVAVIKASRNIKNPDSLPLLQQVFLSQTSRSIVYYWSGTAIANIGNIEATKTLLEWARKAPDIVAPEVQQWLGTVAGEDPKSNQFLRKDLRQNKTFKSKKVRKAVKAFMR
ncbi:MAG: hypothetical protein WCJ84_00320 [Candidatus Peregrinibacteria bacterium]